jgi:hypothetical protein
MSPSNDFHGMAEATAWIVSNMQSKDFRIARSMHLNHKHDAGALAAKQLWFDSRLKGSFTYPAQPEICVELKTAEGRPVVKITPDASLPIECVDIFYTRDGNCNEYANNRTRFWKFVKPVKAGKDYSGHIDLFDLDEPLWIFANVQYKLAPPADAYALTQASDTFTVTTCLKMFSPEQLTQAGVKADGRTTPVIESFGEDWEKEWVRSSGTIQSWCLNQACVPIPTFGKLVIETDDSMKTDLKVEVGSFIGTFPLRGDGTPQTIEVYPFDLKEKKTGTRLLDWQSVPRPSLVLGTQRGVPSFQKISWEEVSVQEFMAKRPFQLGKAVKENGKIQLTFKLADRIDGRIDADNKSVKTKKEMTESDYQEGLQVHSPSEVAYFLKGEFSTFRAKLVACYQASVTFEVYGDGKRLFDSGRMGGQSDPRDIEVDVSGVQELRLVVTEGGNGWSGDWVMWANASCE